MADTKDRRSEGKVSSASAAKARLRRQKRASKGLCTSCGFTEVKNRKMCYDCVDRADMSKMFYYVHKFFNEGGYIDENTGDLVFFGNPKT